MGILEDILAELRQIKAQLGMTAPNQGVPGNQYSGQPIQQAPQQQAPVQQQQPAPATVTVEAITSLIQPHLANDAIKAALGNAMRGMGINALPETQPHQYGELYQRFQAVLAQYAGGAPPVQQAPTSII